MHHAVRVSRLLLTFLFVVLFAAMASAQNFTTTYYTVGSNPRKLIRGDFNADGHEDIATANSDGTVTILVNNGDGTFHRLDAIGGTGSGVGSALVDIVAADFNKDGKLDLAVLNRQADGSASVNILHGRGDGTFDAPVTIANRQSGAAIAVGDFNSDGVPDIAFGWNSRSATVNQYGVYEYHANVSVLLMSTSGVASTHELANVGAQADYANGESGYQIIYMNSGDFDGNGVADFAIAECCGGVDVELGSTYSYTSNGDGTFTAHPLPSGIARELRVADVNNDGKTDLLEPYYGCHTPCYGVGIITDAININNNSGSAQVPDPFSPIGEADGFQTATAADFTGSGQKTVAYYAWGYYWGTTTTSDQGLVGFAAWNGSAYNVVNTFNPGLVYLGSLTYADWNKDGKNDLAAITTSMDGSNPPSVVVYTNVGGAATPVCTQPGSRQMHICAPTSSGTVPGPLRVYAAFNSSTLQSVQIYLDGVKVYQVPTTFAYALDTLLTASAGTHKITVKAWDASGSFSATTYAKVSNSTGSSSGGTGGGGGTCSATSNRTVKICSPLSGSTDTSPVQVLAGLRSDSGVNAAQIYLDGTKVWQGGSGTTTVNQSLAMKSGGHKVTVKGWDSSGSFSSSVTFTVP